MTSVRRVPVGDDDGVRALAALRAAWVAESAGESPRPIDEQFHRSFAVWFEDSDRVFFLAEDGAGGALGMCNVALFVRMPKPDSPPSCWAYLSNVFVAPAHRGSGVGGQLVRAAIDHARAAAAVRVVTAPTEMSRSLYARHGFGAADGLLVLHTS